MHSRIFQVSAEKEFERASEVDYFEDFLGSIADSVEVVEDKDAVLYDIERLERFLNGAVMFNDDYSMMTIVNKRLYFEKCYGEFKASLDKLYSKATEDTFCDGGLDTDMYSVNSSYDDKFGYYIDISGDCSGFPITVSEFMREVKDGDTFYMGTVTDYHF